jgi:hypothetical protein
MGKGGRVKRENPATFSGKMEKGRAGRKKRRIEERENQTGNCGEEQERAEIKKKAKKGKGKERGDISTLYWAQTSPAIETLCI